MRAGSSHSTWQFLGTVTSVLESWAPAAAARGIAGGNFPSSSESGREKENLCCADCACEPLGTSGPTSELVLWEPSETQFNENSWGPRWERYWLSAGSSNVASLMLEVGNSCGASHLLGAGVGEHWYFKWFHKEFVIGCVQCSVYRNKVSVCVAIVFRICIGPLK